MTDPSESGLVTAYVALGSNLPSHLGDSHDILRSALQALQSAPKIHGVRLSPLYRSPPMGPADQPDYLNAVASLKTSLAPLALLDGLQAIENAHGRVRGRRWGERTLDLDLLLYGLECIDVPRLSVPHPGMVSRAFVLQPLYDLAPGLVIEGLGAVSELLGRCDTGVLQRI